MIKQTLLIFAKNLLYGKVKTRLADSVGNDVAFSVYKQLLQHTVSITNYLPVNKIVFYSTYIDQQDMWSNEIYEKQAQSGDDLGERMKNAFSYIFNKEHEKVVIIGTDCLELNSGIITNAFTYLNSHEVVIGPAKDGGYYLLGMKSLHQSLFENIRWSTDIVLNQTLKKCNEQQLSTYLLPELSDVDNINDLKREKELLKMLSYG